MILWLLERVDGAFMWAAFSDDVTMITGILFLLGTLCIVTLFCLILCINRCSRRGMWYSWPIAVLITASALAWYIRAVHDVCGSVVISNRFDTADARIHESNKFDTRLLLDQFKKYGEPVVFRGVVCDRCAVSHPILTR